MAKREDTEITAAAIAETLHIDGKVRQNDIVAAEVAYEAYGVLKTRLQLEAALRGLQSIRDIKTADGEKYVKEADDIACGTITAIEVLGGIDVCKKAERDNAKRPLG
jgi:hypothetical protein